MPWPAKTSQQVLEINLISAQDLKPPSSPRRRLQTYAVTWIDPATKLRTRVDKLGGQNPTWNDKFLFKVTPEFLASDTSGVCVAIYAVGTFRDHLVGTVRFLISNMLSPDADTTPCFSAFQIRRPSGRFRGVMNIGAMVMDGSGFPALEKISAIGYRDLMGEKIQHRRKKTPEEKPKEEEVLSSESCENSCAEEGEGESSTASSSSSPRTTTTTALKDWNGVRELAGNKGLTVTASGFLCCLVTQRSVHQQLTPTNHTIER
ncbi:BON1-associated protein 2 [Spatholobus suberectus]|nr:BON1-associated protein 2 [Spatholobus suberectus]